MKRSAGDAVNVVIAALKILVAALRIYNLVHSSLEGSDYSAVLGGA